MLELQETCYFQFFHLLHLKLYLMLRSNAGLILIVCLPFSDSTLFPYLYISLLLLSHN